MKSVIDALTYFQTASIELSYAAQVFWLAELNNRVDEVNLERIGEEIEALGLAIFEQLQALQCYQKGMIDFTYSGSVGVDMLLVSNQKHLDSPRVGLHQ